MGLGATELCHFTHEGHAITIQAVPDDASGLLVEAVERGDRIGEAIHVGAQEEAAQAGADLEARIRSGAIALRAR